MAKHRIILNLLDTPPLYVYQYCAGPRQRELGREEVSQMRKDDVAKSVVTERASHIAFVSWKNGSHHVWFDYRRLNAVTVRDSYSISRMNECIDGLQEAKLFFTLNANSG